MSRTKKYIKPRNIKRVKSKKYKHRKKKLHKKTSKKSGAPQQFRSSCPPQGCSTTSRAWFSDQINLKALDEYNKIHANKVAEAQRAKQAHTRLDNLSTDERTAIKSLLTMYMEDENPTIGLPLGHVPKSMRTMQK